MSKKKEKKVSSHHPKLIGISIIIATLTILTLPLLISLYTNNAAELKQKQASQAHCLNAAYANYDTAWKAADKDGDGKISYKDGASDIITSYFDSVLTCYRAHKTPESNALIADYTKRRQEETDKYTTWLASVQNQETIQPQNENNRSMVCISNSAGSSTYTYCQ